MANLIIKSSADNLVLQGSDASPAITVGATGTTTFAENATLSGTANNLGTSTAGTLSSGVTFPAGHLVKSTVKADKIAGAHITCSSTSWVDTGLECSHTTLLSSSDSYLVFEYYCGMVHYSVAAQNYEIKVTMRTVSNSTWTSGEAINGGQYPWYVNNNTASNYLPLTLKQHCGLETEMGMPSTKSSWAAGDTLYFRMFAQRGGSGNFYLCHINSSWNITISEVKR